MQITKAAWILTVKQCLKFSEFFVTLSTKGEIAFHGKQNIHKVFNS